MNLRVSLLLAALVVGIVHAQDPNEWVIESYQIPLTYVDAPVLPDLDADEASLRSFIQKSHEFAKEQLKKRGLIFPKGALFVFDPVSVTLAARLPASSQKIVQREVDSIQMRTQKYIAWNVQILEAPAATIRSAMEKAHETPNHLQLFTKLKNAADVRVVTTLSGETTSGQSAKTEQTNEYLLSQSLEPRSDNSGGFEIQSRQIGTLIEIDPVISPTDKIIDFNLSLEHHFDLPITSTEFIRTGENSGVSRSLVETRRASVITTVYLPFGGAKLLGTWKPDRVKPDESDLLQAAFLSANVVGVLPTANPAVQQLLEKHGDAVLEIPEEQPDPLELRSPDEDDELLPDGMIERTFEIRGPACANKAPAQDPFEPLGFEPVVPRERAQNILEEEGIPFPDGASAHYHPETAKLIVRNTPANIDLVEVYLDQIMPKKFKTLGIAVHLVEAPAEWLRDLLIETQGSADDSEVWAKILEAEKRGDARILRSSWINARSGHRTNITSGQIVPIVTGLEPGTDPSLPLKITTEDRLAGLDIELDPVIGADGRTIDLNLSLEFDYAPPTLLEPIKEVNGGDDRMFHQARIQTSTPLWTGAIRMIGSWKPRDAPGYENAGVLQAAFVRADILIAE
ncbi:MAG: hypothetical protein ACI8UO_004018 [Verrucomicrobiales bacterium]|jgi:hypothetical protein